MAWREAAERFLRQLLNHVICLLKAHFASLCVTSARLAYEYVDSGRRKRVKEQMPQMQENFEMIRNVCAVRVKPERKNRKCHLLPPTSHRFVKLFSIKKEMSDTYRKENIADVSEKCQRRVRSINIGIRKESFVFWIQISFLQCFFIDRLICYLLFTVYFLLFLHPKGKCRLEEKTILSISVNLVHLHAIMSPVCTQKTATLENSLLSSTNCLISSHCSMYQLMRKKQWSFSSLWEMWKHKHNFPLNS